MKQLFPSTGAAPVLCELIAVKVLPLEQHCLYASREVAIHFTVGDGDRAFTS
jgi:hypothetical protein